MSGEWFDSPTIPLQKRGVVTAFLRNYLLCYLVLCPYTLNFKQI